MLPFSSRAIARKKNQHSRPSGIESQSSSKANAARKANQCYHTTKKEPLEGIIIWIVLAPSSNSFHCLVRSWTRRLQIPSWFLRGSRRRKATSSKISRYKWLRIYKVLQIWVRRYSRLIWGSTLGIFSGKLSLDRSLTNSLKLWRSICNKW